MIPFFFSLPESRWEEKNGEKRKRRREGKKKKRRTLPGVFLFPPLSLQLRGGGKPPPLCGFSEAGTRGKVTEYFFVPSPGDGSESDACPGKDLLKAGKCQRGEGIPKAGRNVYCGRNVYSISCLERGSSASGADGRSELTSLKKKSFFRTVYNENQRKNEFFLFFLCIRT